MQNQTYVEKKNTSIPSEVPLQAPQKAVVTLPGLVPTAPMDWPVERFTQALDRRENNRRALLKWISDNLKQGIDFGRIHAVGKDKCSFARDGRADQCDNPRHWSKPSPCGSQVRRRFAGCWDSSPGFPICGSTRLPPLPVRTSR